MTGTGISLSHTVTRLNSCLDCGTAVVPVLKAAVRNIWRPKKEEDAEGILSKTQRIESKSIWRTHND